MNLNHELFGTRDVTQIWTNTSVSAYMTLGISKSFGSERNRFHLYWTQSRSCARYVLR